MSYDIDDLDIYFRTLMYYNWVEEKGKTPIRVPKRLALGKGKKDEVNAYFSTLIAMAAGLGVIIPAPEDRGFKHITIGDK